MSVRHLIPETAGLINAARSVAPIVAVLSEDGPRDGVTTVSCGLATALVAMRRSVAVVDCDFTDPQLHERLAQPQGPGFAAVLAGDARIDDVFNYASTDGDKFMTVTAGENHVRRAPLLSAPTATDAVQRLSELSDIVLLNGAPLNTQSGQDLVALVDSVILIVSSHPPLGPEGRPAMLRGSRPYVAARVADPGAVLRPRDAAVAGSTGSNSRFDIPAPRRATGMPVLVPHRNGNGNGNGHGNGNGNGAADDAWADDRMTVLTPTREPSNGAAASTMATESNGSALPVVFTGTSELPGFEETRKVPAPGEDKTPPSRKRWFFRSARSTRSTKSSHYLD